MTFDFTGALTGYFNARRGGAPLWPALKEAAGTLILLGVTSLGYLLTLNALNLRWNSLIGYSIGLAFGLGALLVLIAFKSWWHRRGSF